GDQHIFAYIMGPVKSDVSLPSSQGLLQTIAMAEKADVKPYEEKEIAACLLEKKPIAGKIVRKTTNAALGTTDLLLSNGATVTLKPTDFKNDEILMGASRYGGTSNYGAADRYNATYALTAVNAMGFGSFSPIDLQKVLAGK